MAFPSKKECHFPFWNIFFHFRDVYVLYYTNEETDDVKGGSTKMVQHSIKNISRNINAMFFKLGPRN